MTFIYKQTAGGIDTGDLFTSTAITCSYCGKVELASFVSGYNNKGEWCHMCNHCHMIYGNGLGILRGQKYELQSHPSTLGPQGPQVTQN